MPQAPHGGGFQASRLRAAWEAVGAPLLGGGRIAGGKPEDEVGSQAGPLRGAPPRWLCSAWHFTDEETEVRVAASLRGHLEAFLCGPHTEESWQVSPEGFPDSSNPR